MSNQNKTGYRYVSKDENSVLQQKVNEVLKNYRSVCDNINLAQLALLKAIQSVSDLQRDVDSPDLMHLNLVKYFRLSDIGRDLHVASNKMKAWAVAGKIIASTYSNIALNSINKGDFE